MITKLNVPKDFDPQFTVPYVIQDHTIFIGIQYFGPLPMVGAYVEMEVSYYMIRFEDHIETGRIEWDPANGALTYEYMAKALIILWDPEKKKLNINS